MVRLSRAISRPVVSIHPVALYGRSFTRSPETIDLSCFLSERWRAVAGLFD
jgi:hypothetical protein